MPFPVSFIISFEILWLLIYIYIYIFKVCHSTITLIVRHLPPFTFASSLSQPAYQTLYSPRALILRIRVFLLGITFQDQSDENV